MPLPSLAQTILKGVACSPERGFVFSTNQKTPVSGFSKTKRRLDAEMKDTSIGNNPTVYDMQFSDGPSIEPGLFERIIA